MTHNTAFNASSMQGQVAHPQASPGHSHFWSRFVHWTGLADVIYAVFFVALFSVVGYLRPGYSPISQAISALGVGPYGPLMDVAGALVGLLELALALDFLIVMRPVLSRGWRWACAVLIALPGLGTLIASLFTAAPGTRFIHYAAGASLGLYFPIITLLVVGLALRGQSYWRGFGQYSLVASLLTLLIVGFMTLALARTGPLASANIGGLAERLDWIDIAAWYAVLGWLFFRLPIGAGRGLETYRGLS